MNSWEPGLAIPKGWAVNPSAWPERARVLLPALGGMGIASYLGLYQLDVIHHVWEPIFQNGSKKILRESSIAHLLPIPDALLGAAAYLGEVILELIGDQVRWRTAPEVVLLLGGLAGGLALGGIVLAIAQPVVFGTACTLCLGSALCSILAAVGAWAEVHAAWRHLTR